MDEYYEEDELYHSDELYDSDELVEVSGERWVNLAYRGGVLLVVVLSAVYALSPVDLIPDIILGAGQLDDLGVAAAGGGSVAFATVVRVIILAILRRPRARAGCFIFVVLGSIFLAIGAGVVFFALYSLIQSL